MKLSAILSLILLFTISFATAQEFNKKGVESKNNEEILIGKCTFDGISGFMTDFNVKMNAYSPDPKVSDELKVKMTGITFTVVLGTWCGDSQDQVPVFSKLMKVINYDISSINFICVDRTKNTAEYNDTDLKIEKVPTFVVYRNGKEIGRIIETPLQSMEFDLSKIISGS